MYNKISKLKESIENLPYEHKDIRTIQALQKILDNLGKIDISSLESLTEGL